MAAAVVVPQDGAAAAAATNDPSHPRWKRIKQTHSLTLEAPIRAHPIGADHKGVGCFSPNRRQRSQHRLSPWYHRRT